MSVMDNVLSGRLGYTSNIRSLFRHFHKEDITQALDYLDRVGLGDQINKRADELSGATSASWYSEGLDAEAKAFITRRTHLGS